MRDYLFLLAAPPLLLANSSSRHCLLVPLPQAHWQSATPNCALKPGVVRPQLAFLRWQEPWLISLCAQCCHTGDAPGMQSGEVVNGGKDTKEGHQLRCENRYLTKSRARQGNPAGNGFSTKDATGSGCKKPRMCCRKALETGRSSPLTSRTGWATCPRFLLVRGGVPAPSAVPGPPHTPLALKYSLETLAWQRTHYTPVGSQAWNGPTLLRWAEAREGAPINTDL